MNLKKSGPKRVSEFLKTGLTFPVQGWEVFGQKMRFRDDAKIGRASSRESVYLSVVEPPLISICIFFGQVLWILGRDFEKTWSKTSE